MRIENGLSAKNVKSVFTAQNIKRFFSFNRFDILCVIEILFYFFCFFPFITLGFLDFGSDMQVYALGIAAIYLIAYLFLEKEYRITWNAFKRLALLFKIPLLMLIAATVAFIVALFLNDSMFNALRSYYNYLSLFCISLAAFLCMKRHKGLFEKIIKLFIWIWLIVGLIQLTVDRSFLGNVVSGFRTSDNRGVCSLASEPSFYGAICFFFILISQKLKTGKLFYAVLSILQLLVFAQSSVALVYLIILGICLLVWFIVKTVAQKKYLPLIIFVAVLVVGLPVAYFLMSKFMGGSRIYQLLRMLFTSPELLKNDASIMHRFDHIFLSLESFVQSFGLPNGFSNDITSTGRIMSGYGTLLHEMGIIGIVLIVGVFIWIYRSHNAAYAVALSIVMFSAIQLGLPLFSFLIGLALYEMTEKQKNKAKGNSVDQARHDLTENQTENSQTGISKAMKITIVTVCYNEEKNIKRTIESVLRQTSTDYEYIICDGASKDQTVSIAKSYAKAFADKGVRYVVNSERDGGIYYGMNNGIERATGDYVYFLNSGDWFYTNDVVEKVVAYAKEKNAPDVVYGHVANVERNTVGILKGNDEGLYRCMSVCHQGVFASTALMQEHKFNTDYRIMADYDFLLGLKLAGKTFSQIDLVIAYFSVGGVSSVDSKGFIRDLLKIHEMRKSNLGALTKLRLRLGTYKTTIAIAVKAKMPLKLWYWWSVKVKKKTLLEK